MPHKRFHPPPYNNTVTTVTCSQHDKFFWDQKRSDFSRKKETYSALSTLFYQFYADLELSERIKGLSKFESRSCLFAFSFISITLLYYYFLNSVYLSSNEKLKGRASTKVSFRIVSTAILTQVSL